jgi:hypothetical protein
VLNWEQGKEWRSKRATLGDHYFAIRRIFIEGKPTWQALSMAAKMPFHVFHLGEFPYRRQAKKCAEMYALLVLATAG